MKTHLSLMLAATLAAVVSPAAADPGRTVAVLRNRPLAINPAPVVSTPKVAYRSTAVARSRGSGGMFAGQFGGVGSFDGNFPFGFYQGGIPAGRNGYVGGLANIPHIVVQIPNQFGRTGYWPTPRPQFLFPQHHGGHPGGGHGAPGGPPAGGGKGK